MINLSYQKLAEYLKEVGNTIENEKNGKQFGHSYIQINPETGELIYSDTKTNLASFKQISCLVKQALNSQDITLIQKKEMLEGYAKIIAKYNQKKETLTEKIGDFFTQIIAYGWWGQASEVDKADSMIKTHLEKYKTILALISPQLEQEKKQQLQEMTEKKRLEEEDISVLSNESKKMEAAFFTAKFFAKRKEEELVIHLHKQKEISKETKDIILAKRAKETPEKQQFREIFNTIDKLFSEKNIQNQELKNLLHSYKLTVELVENRESLAKEITSKLRNKQQEINNLDENIIKLKNELGLI